MKSKSENENIVTLSDDNDDTHLQTQRLLQTIGNLSATAAELSEENLKLREACYLAYWAFADQKTCDMKYEGIEGDASKALREIVIGKR